MLRAAYFGQELLSTFGTTIGEIALIPATGGIFTVKLTYSPETVSTGAGNSSSNGMEVEGSGEVGVKSVLIWDRKVEGGFPETKVLKQRVRDCLEPGRDLGHSDTPSKHAKKNGEETDAADVVDEMDEKTLPERGAKLNAGAEPCADCG
jgi:predicted Rdx family selenoprotein